jgi:hypothetical protein
MAKRSQYDPEAAYREWISDALVLLRELADRERLAFAEGVPLPETLDVIRRGEELSGY